MTPRTRPVATWILSAVALILTLSGIGLCLPFSKCLGCNGEGLLTIPLTHPDRDRFAQECGTCRGTGRASWIAVRSTLRSLTPCRLCGGWGKEPECDFYTGPRKPCEWCGGSGKMSPQKVRQFDLERQERLSRFGN